MKKKPVILVVDDDPLSLTMLETILQQEGCCPVAASNGREALQLLDQQAFDLVLSDMVMPVMDGRELLEQVLKRFPALPFIAITAESSISGAVEAIRQGAYDYLEKPFNPDLLKITLQQALDYQRVVQENRQIRELLKERYTFQSIATVSPAMKQTLLLAERVAAARATTVAIYGESGVGKEVLARAIHFASDAQPNRFVAVNCAAVPEHLLESELFGHVRGAFTGADRDREGKFCSAKGGTILLDEIGDMPLSLQAKLLRVLQERVYEKIGSNTCCPAECRVIVATNRNLAEMVATGRFREDLYHRINIFPLTIPPLRERRDDIPLLCERALGELRQHLGKLLPGISQRAMETMLAYPWPGNVRELRNCLERAAILTDGELIRPEHLGLASTSPDQAVAGDGLFVSYTLKLPAGQLSLATLTDQILAITLERCGGNKSQAAKMLGIARKNFYRT